MPESLCAPLFHEPVMLMFRRMLLALVLLSATLSAEWLHKKEIRLKKDVTEKIMVLGEGNQRLFTFRWTLYVNDRLVLFRSFDRFVAQHILVLNHKNQSIRVALSPKGERVGSTSYVLLKFKAFDFEKNEATFDLFLRDDDEKYILKYLNEQVSG